MLTVEELGKAYRGGPLLFEPVSFSIDAGASVAVRGPHGSGKSTLLRLIAGLETPTCGGARLDGTLLLPRRPGSQPDVWRAFALALPEHPLLPSRTLFENLVLSQRLTGCAPGAAVDAAYEALRRLDLVAVADRMPPALTRTQHQLASLARAVLRRPRVLVVDEPGHGLRAEVVPLARALLDDAVLQGCSLIMAVGEGDRAAPAAGQTVVLEPTRTPRTC